MQDVLGVLFASKARSRHHGLTTCGRWRRRCEPSSLMQMEAGWQSTRVIFPSSFTN